MLRIFSRKQSTVAIMFGLSLGALLIAFWAMFSARPTAATVEFGVARESTKALVRADALEQASIQAGITITTADFPGGADLVRVIVDPPPDEAAYGPTIVTLDYRTVGENSGERFRITVQQVTTRVRTDRLIEAVQLGVDGIEAFVGSTEAGARVYTLVGANRTWLVMVAGSEMPSDEEMRPALIDLVS